MPRLPDISGRQAVAAFQKPDLRISTCHLVRAYRR